jgi:hypothetical protein
LIPVYITWEYPPKLITIAIELVDSGLKMLLGFSSFYLYNHFD